MSRVPAPTEKRAEPGLGASTERHLDPAEVMVYLNVLDRFETPAYERSWRFFRETADQCPDYESFRARCPLWSEPYSEIDRVLCTYETAAILIRHGGLNEDLFFEQIPRVIDVWAAAAPWVDGLRKDYRAGLFRSVEWLAQHMEQWERLRSCVTEDSLSISRDPAGLRRLAGAYRLSQAVAAAASLGVGDALAAGPLDGDAVAAAVGAHPPTMRRLLTALAGEGVLLQDADGRFALTRSGQCLRSDDPDGTRAMIEGWSCLTERYLAFARLHETVMTGRSGFELTFGQSFHEYMEQHPDRAAAYGMAMDSTVESFDEAIAAYDFSGLGTVVDIGGGGGTFLTCLLRRYPAIRGVLFERPAVIERVRLPDDVADRIECRAGDALDAVPAGFDAYVLSTVLRCFDDRGCGRVLGACRRAMPEHARLLALEMVSRPGDPQPLAGLTDLQALMLYGGADRDEPSWRRLMADAGLQLEKIDPADEPFSWLVAAAAADARLNVKAVLASRDGK